MRFSFQSFSSDIALQYLALAWALRATGVAECRGFQEYHPIRSGLVLPRLEVPAVA
jgi:hypothetical protein